jgi:glycosyltransferase involved in cell wall biosynthesis
MGTGAYSETMVRALAQAATRSTITLIVPLGTPRRIQLPNVAYASLPATEGLAEGTRQVALPAYLDAVKADCLFAPASLLPAVKVCPMVATVHDLAFETHTEQYAPALTDYLRRWFPSTLAGADRIVAISEPVKQDLLFRKRVDPAKVVVIEQPIRQTFLEPLTKDQVEAELRALKVETPFFFHVSNLSAHKNMEFGVRVFAEFLRSRPEARHDLLFAGGGFAPSAPPDLPAIARSLGIGHRVKYVGKVSDTTLKALYQRCDAFLFPSLIEGWGLPVVEARTLGAKVLASPHVPSALPAERLPLEPARWVAELSGQAARMPLGMSAPTEDAGNRLLEVILEAIKAYPAREAHSAEPKHPDGNPIVAIRGDWHSPSGFGQAARGVFNALESAGLSPIGSAVPKDVIQDKTLWRGEVTLDRGPADLWIHHVPPEHMDLSLPGKHASFFFWETDRLPAAVSGCDWQEVLSNLDEIWAPSTFIAEVLKSSGVTAPICQISPPVDTDIYSPGPRRLPAVELPAGFDPSWTVILYVGTWDPRKRPDLLIRCFSRAFSEKDNALLLVKSYVTGDASRDREILNTWVSQSRESAAHVRFIPEVLSSGKMADLFRFSTAFASASRGEGYCLPAVQAMSAGKPVIAPNWSAFRDYVTVPVDYRLESIPSEVTLPGYSSDQQWAAVDEGDLTRKLRWIHENRDNARLLGKKARDWVLENASMPVIGKRLRDRIQALCSKNVRLQPLEVMK